MEELNNLLEQDKPVLIKFEAEWCAPCKAYKPTFEQVSKDWSEEINTISIDIDKNADVTQKYSVMGVPTTLLLVDGKEKTRKVGMQSPKALNELLENNV